MKRKVEITDKKPKELQKKRSKKYGLNYLKQKRAQVFAARYIILTFYIKLNSLADEIFLKTKTARFIISQ